MDVAVFFRPCSEKHLGRNVHNLAAHRSGRVIIAAPQALKRLPIVAVERLWGMCRQFHWRGLGINRDKRKTKVCRIAGNGLKLVMSLVASELKFSNQTAFALVATEKSEPFRCARRSYFTLRTIRKPNFI